MEYMLHYAWQHRIFPFGQLHTEDGKEIDIVSVGRHNSDAGPDFIGAQLKIGGMTWAGNVEIHLRSSDWYRHHHDTDAAYDNVILHVVSEIDCEVRTSKGQVVPQMQLDVRPSSPLSSLSGSDTPSYHHSVAFCLISRTA